MSKNAKGPHTSCSKIYCLKVNQCVLNKSRRDIFYPVHTCPHHQRGKNISSPSVNLFIQVFIIHWTKALYIPGKRRFRLVYYQARPKNPPLPEHGRPLSRGSPPSRVKSPFSSTCNLSLKIISRTPPHELSQVSNHLS